MTDIRVKAYESHGVKGRNGTPPPNDFKALPHTIYRWLESATLLVSGTGRIYATL